MEKCLREIRHAHQSTWDIPQQEIHETVVVKVLISLGVQHQSLPQQPGCEPTEVCGCKRRVSHPNTCSSGTTCTHCI